MKWPCESRDNLNFCTFLMLITVQIFAYFSRSRSRRPFNVHTVQVYAIIKCQERVLSLKWNSWHDMYLKYLDFWDMYTVQMARLRPCLKVHVYWNMHQSWFVNVILVFTLFSSVALQSGLRRQTRSESRGPPCDPGTLQPTPHKMWACITFYPMDNLPCPCYTPLYFIWAKYPK